MSRRHVLVVSWWFPPLAGGGVYRPLNFVRGLVERDYEVTVLTAKPSARHGQDPSLMDRVPAGVRILRCPHFDPFQAYESMKKLVGRGGGRANGITPPASPVSTESSNIPAQASFKDRLSEGCALPDKWRSWVIPATLRAVAGMIGNKPDVIFCTSPPHSLHLIGLRLKSHFGCPLVVDFRDPWIGNPFRKFSAESLIKQDERLEHLVIHEAAQVICNTPPVEDRFRQRYPDQDCFRTITNGFSPELAENMPEPPTFGSEPVEFLHVGHLYGARSGRYLLQALQVLRSTEPRVADSIRVRLIGQIERQDDYLQDARDRGVEDLLMVEGSIPHSESLARQRDAKALLILGVEEKGLEVQVPGKLYEYFAMRRPILTLSRRGGAIQQVAELAKVPYEIGEPDDPQDIAAAIARFVGRAESGELSLFDTAAIMQFRYDVLTQRFEECLCEAMETAPAASLT